MFPPCSIKRLHQQSKHGCCAPQTFHCMNYWSLWIINAIYMCALAPVFACNTAAGFYFSLAVHYETRERNFQPCINILSICYCLLWHPNCLLLSLGMMFSLFRPFTIRFPPRAAFLLNSFKLLNGIKWGFHNELMEERSTVSILAHCRQRQLNSWRDEQAK